MSDIFTSLKDALARCFTGLGFDTLLLRLLPGKKLFLVGYHRICSDDEERVHVLAVTRSRLREHLRYYRKHFEVVSLDEVPALLSRPKLDRNYMVVTFDDGYRDNFTLGYDLFAEFGRPATVYLTAGPIEDRVPLWTDAVDDMVHRSERTSVEIRILGLKGTFPLTGYGERQRLTELLKEEIKLHGEEAKREALSGLARQLQVEEQADGGLMLHWDEVRRLQGAGVRFGSHTLSHPTLSRLEPDKLREELEGSKRLIEDRTDGPVGHFAYPYGKAEHYNDEVKRETARHYATAVTAINGVNGPGADPHELLRVIVENIPIHRLRLRLLLVACRDYLNKERGRR